MGRKRTGAGRWILFASMSGCATWWSSIPATWSRRWTITAQRRPAHRAGADDPAVGYAALWRARVQRRAAGDDHRPRAGLAGALAAPHRQGGPRQPRAALVPV